MSDGKYTDAALRERLKKKIMAGTKGGDPGEWSARKAQLLASEYKAKGGGYKGGKSDSQKSLSKWTSEKWRTSDGKPAKRSDGKGGTTTTRYLPDKAWDKLSPAEKKATNEKKKSGDAKGKQFVPNTSKAKSAGKKARDAK